MLVADRDLFPVSFQRLGIAKGTEAAKVAPLSPGVDRKAAIAPGSSSKHLIDVGDAGCIGLSATELELAGGDPWAVAGGTGDWGGELLRAIQGEESGRDDNDDTHKNSGREMEEGSGTCLLPHKAFADGGGVEGSQVEGERGGPPTGEAVQADESEIGENGASFKGEHNDDMWRGDSDTTLDCEGFEGFGEEGDGCECLRRLLRFRCLLVLTRRKRVGVGASEDGTIGDDMAAGEANLEGVG